MTGSKNIIQLYIIHIFMKQIHPHFEALFSSLYINFPLYFYYIKIPSNS